MSNAKTIHNKAGEIIVYYSDGGRFYVNYRTKITEFDSYTEMKEYLDEITK